ncbi:FAD-dependent oxidoreductase [Bordetella hinzii]|uniref:FAD-dependent oxidoreductase n=1 Tax=Bordetella hinzii TaxID=103855 RepID=UPI0009B89FC2|nr:FAD-dependent oxidoreductase [Bordetella hinzii]QDJ45380.1 monooxygenase [Bordetella hinzii]WPL79011.1 NAD(P)-binding domain-containing protein [Bordetella hinzii]
MDARALEHGGAARTTAPADHVRHWLRAFEQALAQGSAPGLAALFAEDCHWRDLLAFTWNITPHDSLSAIVERLASTQPSIQARGFTLPDGRTPPRQLKRLGVEVIEAIFEFETAVGRAEGVVRLLQAQPGKAWVLMTSLKEFKGHEALIGARRPSGAEDMRMFGGPNWADRRAVEQRFEDREPAVLIVGAGQAGLAVAARLRLLGVDALVVDRLPRVGDVWRTRYHALALHNQVMLNHLPYLPFPPSWPKYLPKDMVGQWLETYAQAMECNVWTATTLVSGGYDETARHWQARVRRADGSERVLRPRHLVFANGVVGAPRKAAAPGLDDFRGEIIHTHAFKRGAPWRGKHALVLGAGTSGHDIAQDLASSGAHVTLIQRGSITVASVQAAGLNHAIYYNEGLPLEDTDLIAASSTYPLLVRGYQMNVAQMKEIDRDLLEGLKAKGMKLDFGEDETGHQMKLRRRFGGYYLNCGASDMIISGQIGLLQYEDIDRFVAEGLRLKDGSVVKADLLVTATGYHNQQEVLRDILGPAIADKVGRIWGIAEDGELANMFRPTPQPGLWFIGGGLSHSRIYSHYIALQIKAREAGLLQ